MQCASQTDTLPSLRRPLELSGVHTCITAGNSSQCAREDRKHLLWRLAANIPSSVSALFQSLPRGLSVPWHCNREHSAAVASSPRRLGAISKSVNVAEVFVPGKEL